MSSTLDEFIITFKTKDHAKKFSKEWKRILGEKDYLYSPDETEDILDRFVKDNKKYVLKLEEEPLFSYYNGGDQIHLVILSFLESFPEIELDAEYMCTFDNTPDALLNIYSYHNGILHIRCAYSEQGEGDYCPICEKDIEPQLIRLNPSSNLNDFVCPHCGAKLKYDADIAEYDLELVHGRWKYPREFPFRLDGEQDIMDIIENGVIPGYILNKTEAKKTGMTKIMLTKDTAEDLKNIEAEPIDDIRRKITIDFVDLPYTLVATPDDETGNVVIRLFCRQVYDDEYENEDGTILWNPSDSSILDVEIEGDIDEAIPELAITSYDRLASYLESSDQFRDYDTTDLQLENLFVYTEEGKIYGKIIYGKGRPDLLAYGLFDGFEYVRPCAREEELVEERKDGMPEEQTDVEEPEKTVVSFDNRIDVQELRQKLESAKIGSLITMGQWFLKDDSSFKFSINSMIRIWGKEKATEEFYKAKGDTFPLSMDEWLEDNTKKPENIRWVMTDIVGNRFLLVSESIIGIQEFNRIDSSLTWKNSFLRKWLNGDFYDKAFSQEEKRLIVQTEVPNDSENPRKWEKYNSTKDKVFLLSREELEKYYPNEKDREVFIDSSAYPYTDSYWVRTPGKRGEDVAVMKMDGTFGETQCNDEVGVRISVWVQM